MPKIINPEERKDHDLTVIYSALDAEDCIYLSLSFFRKEVSTMLPIVVQSLVLSSLRSTDYLTISMA